MVEGNYYFVLVDEYILGFVLDVQVRLQVLRQIICEVVLNVEEKISYQMLMYVLYGNLVYFVVYKNYIGFYFVFSGIEVFWDEFFVYKGVKGLVQFFLN